MIDLVIIFLVIAVVTLFINSVRLAKHIVAIDKQLQAIEQRVIDNDKQFDDERALLDGLEAGEYFTGMSLSELTTQKETDGKPTLLNPF